MVERHEHLVRSLLSIAAVVGMSLVSARALAAEAKDPLTGTFTNAQIRLVLEAAGDRYVGKAAVEGQSYAVSARRVAPNTIEGTYTEEGQQIPFRAVLAGDRMSVMTGGEVLVLLRQPGVAPTQAAPKPPTARKLPAGELGDPAWGIRFKPPAGWVGRKAGGLFVLGSEKQKGVILVMPHEAKSTAELRQAAAEGLDDGDGTRLKLAGQPRDRSPQGVGAEFTGTMGGKPAKAYAVGLVSLHGTGAVILAAVEPGSYTKAYPGFVDAVARTVRFHAPEVPAIVGEWKQDLSGWRLTYLWSYFSGGGSGAYAGGSQKTEIDLCPQGYFRFRDRSSISVDGGFSGGYNVSAGRHGRDMGNGLWDVARRGGTPVLRLTFHDGRVQEYTLSFENRKLFLNGKRFFRGERAPCD